MRTFGRFFFYEVTILAPIKRGLKDKLEKLCTPIAVGYNPCPD